MDAIIYMTIPIHYSKSGVLYFDSIKNFDSENFIYLKNTRPCNPFSQFATHKINMIKSIEMINKKILGSDGEINKLDKLILNIKEMIDLDKINFGFPMGVHENEIVDLNDENLESFLWENVSVIDDIEEGVLTSSSHFKGLVKVGHGLCFIDEDNSFMYDAGGSIGYDSFIKRIPNIKYDIVISHIHLDHYKYLNKLNLDGFVKSVLLPPLVYVGEKGRKILKNIKNSKAFDTKISVSKTVNTYDVFIPNPLLVIKSDLNTSSLLVKGNDWLLTGDSRWNILNDRFGKKAYPKNITVPHHGSSSSGAPKSSFFSGRKEFWASYRTGVHKLPNHKIDKEYKKLGNLHKVKG